MLGRGFWVALLGVVPALVVVACGDEGQTSSGGGGEGGFITGAGGSTVTSSSTSSSASSTSSSSSASGMGGASSSSTGGQGGMGPTCNDIGLGEPNESEGTAWSLKTVLVEDCDGDGGSITGTIAPGDVDWFTYDGDDTTFCVVNPERTISQSQTGIRLCKFIECVGGGTTITCPGGTTDATSPEGRVGCCSNAGFEISDVNCPGLDENTHVYIRVDQPGGDSSTCNDYTLTYHY